MKICVKSIFDDLISLRPRTSKNASVKREHETSIKHVARFGHFKKIIEGEQKKSSPAFLHIALIPLA